MIKSFSTLVLLLLVQTLFAQEAYVSTGKNYTTYYNTRSENPLLKSSNKIFNPGNSYEVGMKFNQNSTAVAYSVGLNFNEYNTSYIIPGAAIRYDWQTQYVGIQNSLVFDILHSDSRENALQINAKLGLNAALFVNGYQNANGVHYQITANEDYKKFIFQPFGGLQLAYPVSDDCKFNVGYQLSIANIGKDAGNTFNYINQMVQLGLSISIN